MHRLFRERLDEAKGISEFVIVLNIDIRGFSDWSLEVDSAQTALFIKKIYAKLIDKYFADAAFLKPTGDGLLVVLNFDEEEVASAVTKVIQQSMEIVKSFGTLCANEPAINFAVPQNVGIGISRGAASRLISDDLTLDYSGRVLNQASRLMDIARPRGVVFDSQFGFELLPKELRGKFKRHDIYLKGVSPRTPLEVRCWPRSIKIARVNQFPIGQPQWEHIEAVVARQDLIDPKNDESSHEGSVFSLDLPSHPPDPRTLTCEIRHDVVLADGRPSNQYFSFLEESVSYVDSAGQAQAHIDEARLAARLEKEGVGMDWPVRIKVSFRML
jgi:class 3 adenylate cyclase